MSETGSQVFNGRYELHRKIARGGMAEVHLARDSLLDRPVALKVLFPEFATDPAFVQRFRREAQAAANLSHPNIVSVYDWGEEAGTYFIVMEYVEGRSLAQIVRDEGPVHPDRAADITIDIAAALGFAHRNGVIHRDVKPGNVLIAANGQVKVTDFGIARAVSTQENLTQTGTVMGTATYFSPEQARGDPVDPRSDVYSLGVVLYELLSGQPPFSGDNPVTVAYKHVQETPEPVRQRNAVVPLPLEAVVMKAMAKNPANRYASADDLGADLQRFRDGQPVVAEPLLSAPVEQPTQAVTAATAAGATRAVPAADGTRVARRAESYEEYDYGDAEPARRSAAFIVVLAVLLLVLAGLLFLLARELDLGGTSATQVEVPSVLSLPQPEATRILTDAGLEVQTEQEANDDVPEGQVFAQDPSAGTRVDEGSTVTITVSSGQPPVEVPAVVGERLEDAESQLRGLGLTADVRPQASEEVPAGVVISQDPEPGTELPGGSAVVLTVSSGPPKVAVADVRGRSSAEAANILGRQGFETIFQEEQSTDVPEGRVIRTEPAAGTELAKGERVVVVVSSGPPPTTTTTTTTTVASTTTTTTADTTTTTEQNGGGGGGGG